MPSRRAPRATPSRTSISACTSGPATPPPRSTPISGVRNSSSHRLRNRGLRRLRTAARPGHRRWVSRAVDRHRRRADREGPRQRPAGQGLAGQEDPVGARRQGPRSGQDSRPAARPTGSPTTCRPAADAMTKALKTSYASSTVMKFEPVGTNAVMVFATPTDQKDIMMLIRTNNIGAVKTEMIPVGSLDAAAIATVLKTVYAQATGLDAGGRHDARMASWSTAPRSRSTTSRHHQGDGRLRQRRRPGPPHLHLGQGSRPPWPRSWPASSRDRQAQRQGRSPAPEPRPRDPRPRRGGTRKRYRRSDG